VDVVGFVEGYAVVEPVQTEEIVENVPRGTHESKKKSEAVFHLPDRAELERRKQDQLQKLHEWEKRKTNINTNSNPRIQTRMNRIEYQHAIGKAKAARG